jgi:transposase
MTAEESLFVQQLLEERDRHLLEKATFKSRLDECRREADYSAILQSSSFQAQLDYYEQCAFEAASVLSEKEAIIEKQGKALHSKDKTILTQQEQLLYLKHQVDKLRRMIWGKKSEKHIPEDPLQRWLDFEGVDLLPEEEEQASSIAGEIKEYKEKRPKVHKEGKPVRRPLPEDLERIVNEITPEEVIGHEEDYVEVAPETREVLVYTPGSCYVRKDVRRKFIPKDKEQKEECPVITAPLPTLPLAKSYADASLLAELIIGKYAWHLPFYRQVKMFHCLGVDLPESTIAGWREGVADLLRPTYYRLLEQIMATDYVQADETTIPIVNDKKKKTVKGYLWMVRSPMAGLTAFYYDHGSRAQKVALHLFKDFQGFIQSDGYPVYDSFEAKNGVCPIGCWAHARRKYEESGLEDKERSEYALTQIGLLYDIERMADEQQLSYEERAALRTRMAYPLMQVFEKWIIAQMPKVMPKSRIAKALKYTYNIYHKLTRYHLDGRLKIDNNAAENKMKDVALGRKNWLFCKSDSSAEDAAVIYSMMACCKEADVDFRQWLVFFLNNVHRYDNDLSMDLVELLPHAFKNSNKKPE